MVGVGVGGRGRMRGWGCLSRCEIDEIEKQIEEKGVYFWSKEGFAYMMPGINIGASARGDL